MIGSRVSAIINEWVENRLALPFTIYSDMIPDTAANAACLRYDPAPAAERRYIDGTRLLKWNLSYYIRNANRATAREYAEKISGILDGQTLQADEKTIDIEALTLPQFVNMDEKNNSIYSVSIAATYIETPEKMEE